MQMLMQSKERLHFDKVFVTKPNRLCDSRRIEELKQKAFKIGRNIKNNASDTNMKMDCSKGYLQPPTLCIVWD